MQVLYDKGIFLPDVGLWMDATTKRDRSFVSHAHSDHVGRHDLIISTPATARLVHHRYRPRSRFHHLDFGQEQDFDGWTLTLLPAGHVHGAAQALIRHGNHTLLYSGDFKLKPSLSADQAATPPADTLIMETTFGRPHFRFPPAEQVTEQIAAFCRLALRDGCTPVLFAYSLGKAQELLCRLAGRGFTFAAHDTVRGVNGVYREGGVELPAHVPPEAGTDGHVVVCPSHVQRSEWFASLRRPRTAYISGWAADAAARRLRADAAFPLSDHADYDELIEFVERVKPRRVCTVYGYASEFAADLRLRGYDARPIAGPMQGRLF